MSAPHQSGRSLEAVCVGILASDPLRSIGLQSILEDGLKLRTVILPAVSRSRACKPNVVIVDEKLNGEPGLSDPLCKVFLESPGVAVILLAQGEYTAIAHKALAAGARGALPENAQIAEIRACVRAVLRGGTWVAPEQDANRTQPQTARANSPPSLAKRLTPREREVMQWLKQGRSNREIAATMGIDEATVKAHLGRMLRKAAATNRVELTLRALAERTI